MYCQYFCSYCSEITEYEKDLVLLTDSLQQVKGTERVDGEIQRNLSSMSIHITHTIENMSGFDLQFGILEINEEMVTSLGRAKVILTDAISQAKTEISSLQIQATSEHTRREEEKRREAERQRSDSKGSFQADERKV